MRPLIRILGKGGKSAGLSYAQTVLQDSPVAFWSLNDAEGSTTATDLGPNGLTLTNYGATFGAPTGKSFGTGVAVNGTSGYLALESVESALNLTSAVAIEAWVNVSSAQGNNSGNWLAYLYNSGYRVRVSSMAPDFVADGTDYLTSPTALTAGRLSYVLIQSGPSGTEIFINNVLVASNTTAFRFLGDYAGSNGLYLGWAGDSGGPAEGLIATLANVAIYGGLLSASRIQAHYNAGIS